MVDMDRGHQMPAGVNLPNAGPQGFQTFVDPAKVTRGNIPISPVGPGTLGGMPFRPNPAAEGIAGMIGLITNILEAKRVRDARGGGGDNSQRDRLRQLMEQQTNQATAGVDSWKGF